MSAGHHTDEHGGSHLKGYLVVFGALTVFTAISFVANHYANTTPPAISPHTSFAIILSVAVVKAILVAAFFMHLTLDWGRVYFMIIPAFILGTMMVIVLLPDVVIYWHRVTSIPNPPLPLPR